MNKKIINRELSNDESEKIANKVIDLLSPVNIADKVFIISNLYDSLIDTINEAGYNVLELKQDANHKQNA